MPGSSPEGKREAVEMVRDLHPRRVLDVGPGTGTWHALLSPLWKAEWTCIEIWAPYVDQYDLGAKYDRVVVGNAASVPLAELDWSYDLAIFGDVIEHLEKPSAVEMVARLPWKRALISLPIIEYRQGPWEGNPYEAHRATWSERDVLDAFPVVRHWTGVELGVFLLEREPHERPSMQTRSSRRANWFNRRGNPLPAANSTPSWLLPGPVRRFRDHLREIRRVAGETQRSVIDSHRALSYRLDQLETRLEARMAETEARMAETEARIEERASQTEARLEARVAATEARIEELASRAEAASSEHHAQLLEGLRFVQTRGRWERERLRELRADPAYERLYTEADPLVSVLIRTYDRPDLLRERAIPSVLAQTYQNFEILVVGDAAPDAAREVVESFEEPRIRFSNLPYRGPYAEDPEMAWCVLGVPPYNHAVHLAQGLWVAPLDDDDAFRPQHLERLLTHARRERLEFAYSQMCQHTPDGDTTLGRFPPERGQFGFGASLFPRSVGLVFELELADGALGIPSDWALCLRMMEAGVRIGMLDEVTVDYHPSLAWMTWPKYAREA